MRIKRIIFRTDNLQNKLRILKIAHCDIKPANLIYNNKKLYIIDWYHAKVFREQREVNTIGVNDHSSMKIYGYINKCENIDNNKLFDYV